VRASRYQITNAIAAKKISCTGISPNSRLLIEVAYTRGSLLTALPFVATIAMPVKSSDVPSVARIGGMRIFETSAPLNTPAIAPISIESANDSGIAYTGSPPSAVASAFIIIAIRIDVRFATPTTERSMPPVIMHTMMPSAISPNSGNCANIVCTLISV